MKKTLSSAVLIATIAAGALLAEDPQDKDKDKFAFQPNSIVLSRSVYEGTPATVTLTPAQTLPPNCVAGTIQVPLLAGGNAAVKVKCGTASDNGEYPNLFDNHNVWNNDTPDGSFGVTSPVFLDNLTTEGKLIGTLPIPPNVAVTSFSSKSELAVNRSTDGKSITFVAYRGGAGFVTAANQLDVSNSNTPGVVDPTNPVTSKYYRSVIEVDNLGTIHTTDGNAYSGNNGRAAIKGGGYYYLAGNDNNGGLNAAQLTGTQVGLDLVHSTGAELLVPGAAPGVPQMIGEFAVQQIGYATADKPGKDNNFRGLTISNNTLYMTKGSGGNGINTVYQVGHPGVLPTPFNAPIIPPNRLDEPITILPGFPTNLASGVGVDNKIYPVAFPFGIWFADATTLYVCDEGDPTVVTGQLINGQVNVATPGTLATAGVQKWLLINGTWKLQYVLQDGLNIGFPYSVSNYPSPLNPATGGCRNLTGRRNGEGTVELYAVTSTLSANGDQGADPNKLVKVTDLLKATSLPASDHSPSWGHFTTLRSAQAGEVLRGVSLAPTDKPEDDGNDD